MSAYIDNTNSVTLSPNTSRLYRCYKVINTMLSKRGYAVNVDNINMTPTAFISKFGQDPDRSSMTIMVEKTDESGKKLMVFFPTDEKVGVKPIKQYTDFMTTSGAQNAIIVLRQGITTFAKQAVAELAATHTIEHFKEVRKNNTTTTQQQHNTTKAVRVGPDTPDTTKLNDQPT